MAGKGSLLEIQEKWNISDVFDAHEALDTLEELEADAANFSPGGRN